MSSIVIVYGLIAFLFFEPLNHIVEVSEKNFTSTRINTKIKAHEYSVFTVPVYSE